MTFPVYFIRKRVIIFKIESSFKTWKLLIESHKTHAFLWNGKIFIKLYSNFLRIHIVNLM